MLSIHKKVNCTLLKFPKLPSRSGRIRGKYSGICSGREWISRLSGFGCCKLDGCFTGKGATLWTNGTGSTLFTYSSISWRTIPKSLKVRARSSRFGSVLLSIKRKNINQIIMILKFIQKNIHIWIINVKIKLEVFQYWCDYVIIIPEWNLFILIHFFPLI